MRVIEAPNYTSQPHEIGVFLAGGITGCANWQNTVISMLADQLPPQLPVCVFNPRRAQFPMDNPDSAREQIKWEFEHLQSAMVVLFWFAPETINPIVLYELGYQLGFGRNNNEMVIGIDPNYVRKEDVIIQTQLTATNIPMVFSLSELGAEAVRLIVKRHEYLDAIMNESFGK